MNIGRIAAKVVAKHSIAVMPEEVSRVVLTKSGAARISWSTDVLGADELLRLARVDVAEMRKTLRERIKEPTMSMIVDDGETGFLMLSMKHPLTMDAVAFEEALVSKLGFSKV